MEVDTEMSMESILTLETSSSEFSGIEAHDVSSLLEQFEEASQSSEDSGQPSGQSGSQSSGQSGSQSSGQSASQSSGQSASQSSGHFSGQSNSAKSTPESKQTAINKVIPGDKVCPTKALAGKLKSGMKRKSAIMLPLGVPSGKGRGQAVTLPLHCSSPKLQKIIHKTATQAAQTPVGLERANTIESSETTTASVSEVSSSYYDDISDHDYCQNFPHSVSPPNTLEDKPYQGEEEKLSVNPTISDTNDSEEVLQLHDPESAVFDVTFRNKCSVAPKVALKEKFGNIKRKITHSEYKHRRRNYRKKEESVEFPEDSGQFFDKIPSYYTTLSLPSKPPKKDQKKDAENGNCGIKVTDFIQREISPSVNNNPDVYNKLPAYHNCFINSTKYDNSSAANTLSLVEAVKLENPKYPWDRLRDNINRENPNSRSQSPLLMLPSRYESKSREISRSRSSSRHSSRSRCRSSSSSTDTSRSRSRGRDRRRSRKRLRRRQRGHSYSSYSSVSSDSDWSYCSRSSSCSRDRYYSRSHSRDSSYSPSPHRHRHKSRRDPSYERRREERQKLREEEKKRQIEERRIVYVGKIPDTFTRKQLRDRFDKFGEIEETSVHFRESGDNYGFVTYAYTCDAYAAIENGNKVAGEQPFDLCFGGRREFCTTNYADLDGQVVEEEEDYYSITRKPAVLDFDQLLNEARRKLQK